MTNFSRVRRLVLTVLIAILFLSAAGLMLAWTIPASSASAEAAETKAAAFTPTKFTTTFSTSVNGYTITGFDTTAQEWIKMTAEQKANIAIVIPATYNDGTHGERNVVAIGDRAFNMTGNTPYRGYTFISLDLSGATNLVTIGTAAFRGCAVLTGDLTFPNSVTTIGSYAFDGCAGFTSALTLPNNSEFKTIGDDAFNRCSGLTGDLTIPNSVTTIGKRAFERCAGFTGALTLPYNTEFKIIEELTFRDCTGLTGDLTIPNSVTTIGNEAFYACKGFNGTLTLPSNTEFKTIEKNAFNNCYGLTGSLTIPDSVTTIGNYAFSACKGFKGALTLGTNNSMLTTIGIGVFQNCTGFTGNLNIPDSVTTIGSYAFFFCSALNGTLTLPSNSELKIIQENAFKGCSGLSDGLTIPNSVTAIEGYAFFGCSGFTGKLTLPNNSEFKTIGGSAFSDCSGFTGDLIIPDSVTTIGCCAFEGCTGFKGKLALPNNTEFKSIEMRTFQKCTGLTGGLTIPNSVTTIGKSAFYGCAGFSGDLKIPNSVTTIEESAFSICKGFNGKLTLPINNEFKTIGKSAFNVCAGFSGDLKIPNSVTTIGGYAFYGCSGLTGDLTIPDSVTAIGGSAFSGCTSFTGKLTLPNNTEFKEIGSQAFLYCSSLTGKLTIPNSVTTIGNYAFGELSSMQTVYLPNNASGTTYDIYIFNATRCPIIAPSKTLYETYKASGHSLSGYGSLTYETEVTFNANGGMIGSDSSIKQTKLFGYGLNYEKDAATLIWAENAEYKLPTASKTDYTFADWNSQSDGNGVAAAAATKVTNAPTYYAQYDILMYSTTYDAQSGYTITGFTQAYLDSLNTEQKANIAIVIPAAYNDGTHGEHNVVAIGESAFAMLENAKPEYNGFAFTSLDMSGATNLKIIDAFAFYRCNALAGSLTIPDSVTIIGRCAFSGCAGFTGNLTLPNNTEFTAISDDAFYQCAYFTGELNIPDSVKSIGNSAFERCSGFTGTLTLPSLVKTIGDNAFERCTGFTGDLIIPMFVTTIGISAFQDCTGFTGDLTIPNSVTTIKDNAFASCKGFKGTLTLGTNDSNLTTIKSSAFYMCDGLKGVLAIPDSVLKIEKSVFLGCRNMQTVYLPNNTSGTTYGANIFDSVRCPIVAPSKTLHETYKASGHSLSGYGNLTYETEVTFNANGGMIGSDSSIKQTKLFGYGLNYEKDAATLIWAENSTYKLPAAEKTDCNFKGWNNQTDGNGVAAAAATKVIDAPTYYAQYDILMYSTTYDAQSGYTITGFTQAYLDSLSTEERKNIAIVIPAVYNDGTHGEHNVVEIGQNAFTADSYINPQYRDFTFTSLNLSGATNLKTIGDSAFSACIGFTGDLIIPDSVTTIGNNAFNGCSGFTGDLTIPDSVTTIGKYAFLGCIGFKGALTLGTNNSKLTTIGDGAFNGCTGFTGALTIPNSVTTIGDYAFSGCEGFNGKLTLGTENSALTTIGNRAFLGCSSFKTSLIIPDSVTTIGDNAFFGCTGLQTVYLPNNADTTYGANTFASISPIVAPNKSLYEAYKVSGHSLSEYDNLTYETEVTFNANGGMIGSDSSIKQTKLFGYSLKYEKDAATLIWAENSTYKLPAAEKTDCNFKGWNSQFNGNGVAVSADTAVTDAPTYYAAYDILMYSTTYDAQSGYTITGFTQAYLDSLNTEQKANIAIVIPATYNDGSHGEHNVVAIGVRAFAISGNTQYQDYAFTSLDLSGATNLITIGTAAFISCSSLTGGLTIPDSVTTIGSYAFAGCASFTGTLTLGTNNSILTTIGSSAFNACRGFTGALTIPNSVTTIGDNAFFGCTGLQTVYLPNNADTTYGANTFASISPIVAPNKSLYEMYKVSGHSLSEYTNLTYETEVTFNANGGTLSGKATQAKLFGYSLKYEKDAATLIWAENAEYKLPTASKTDYTFADWNSQSDGNGDAAAADTAVTHAPTYYARYAEIFDSILAEGTPNKVVYTAFDVFDATGLTVKAVYKSGFTKTLSAGDYTIAYTGSNGSLRYGDNSVMISYAENGMTGTAAITGLTVNKKQISMPTVARNYIYDGRVKQAPLKGIVSAIMTRDGDAQGTNAGDYYVSVTLTDNNYAWAGSTSDTILVKWTIAAAKIDKPAADATEFTYNGQAQTYQLTENAAYSITGNVNTDAGEYEVMVALNNPQGVINYEWTTGGSDALAFKWVIAKKKLAITPSYDTSAKVYAGGSLPAITASEITAGAIAWDAPIDLSVPAAGKAFGWTWTPSDTRNYETVTGVISLDVLAVELEGITVTAQPTKKVYTAFEDFDAAGMSVTAIYSNGTKIVTDYIIINGTSLEAGTDSLTVQYTYGGITKEATVSITVNKLQLLKPTISGSYTYTGYEQTAAIEGLTDKMTAANDKRTNAGVYYVAVALSDRTNYEWIDGTDTDISLEWTIETLKVTAPTSDTTEFTYTGGEQTYTVAPSDKYVVSGDKRTNAGEQIVTIALKDKANTEWKGGGTHDITFTFRIAKADYDMSGVTFEDSVVKEDGKAHKIEATGLPEGVTALYAGTNGYAADGARDAGVYEVTVIFNVADADNYNAPEAMTATLYINLPEVTGGTDENGEATIVIGGEDGVKPGTSVKAEEKPVDEYKESNIVIGAEKHEVLQATEIKLERDGAAVQPDGSVTVRLLIKENLRGYENLKIVYIAPDGSAQDMNATRDGNYMVFEAATLNVYVIAAPLSVVSPPAVQSNQLLGGGAIFGIILLIIIVLLILLLLALYCSRKDKNEGFKEFFSDLGGRVKGLFIKDKAEETSTTEESGEHALEAIDAHSVESKTSATELGGEEGAETLEDDNKE